MFAGDERGGFGCGFRLMSVMSSRVFDVLSRRSLSVHQVTA